MFPTLTNRQESRAQRVRLKAVGTADNPWRALWAMMVGFFMILVDATIVAVANPSIMDKLGAGYDAVIWVTSAYLLAYAVPLLVAGRLGDRYGPKNLYLLGLTVFTAASLWCGLSGSIETLVAARVVQGIGAALLTPQTLSTITRIFPADRRGVAMSVWGATAGVATLVGPLAGGVLVDSLGWQWIFIVNVPVGIVGLGLAVWLIPALPTQKHRFDVLGVLLSGLAMFLIVFALQEGQAHDWAPWIWGTIAAGVGFMAAFLCWQSVNRNEPLIPLGIFRDRDFSMSTLGVATIGFVVTAMILPVMFYAQAVCGLSPTRAALLTAPMAIATGVLAPFVGKIIDRSHPRPVIGFGFSVLAISLTWLSVEMTPATPIWRLVLPLTAMGIASAFIWSPLAATATRNLPLQQAGAGSGVYNATRQVGSVLGSAGMAAFMTSRIGAELPPMPAGAMQGEGGGGSVVALPAFLHEPFAAAMSQALLLPAFIALFGVIGALFMLGFPTVRPAAVDGGVDDDVADADRLAGYAVDYGGDETFVDDDEYLEYTVSWDDDEPEPRRPQAPNIDRFDETVTEPMRSRTDHLLHAPGTTWHWSQDNEPTERMPKVTAEPVPEVSQAPPAESSVEPISFAHNGFHFDEEEERFQPLGRPEKTGERPARHHRSDEEPERRPFWFQADGRHSRVDPDETSSRGRHSMPGRD